MNRKIEACKTALTSYDLDVNPATVLQKSRDFYWYSPVLKRQLRDLTGDFVVAPRSVAEVSEILAICWHYDVPVTTRGGGTGNYGQAMPLNGGAILHMKHLDRITSLGDNYLVAEAGAIIESLEKKARQHNREIRLFPSTTASATIGGFVAGGSSGVGAIRWGGLRNPDNLRRLRLVTMEQRPRTLDLTGSDIHKVAHSYGVTGVITEVEIPIDAMSDWVDILIGVEGFGSATHFAIELGENSKIFKRMLSSFQAPIAETYFLRHGPYLRPGEAVIAMMVSPQSLPELTARIEACPGATLRYRSDRSDPGEKLPAVFELAWNHTTLRALRIDPAMTYLQMMIPRKRIDDALERLMNTFANELLLHFEFTRFDGIVTPVGIPLIRFSNEERLEEIVRTIEEDIGLPVFNPHRVTLEEGGMKRTDITQLEFKRMTDPKGLLNPGKMIAWTDPGWVPRPGKTFLFEK